MCGIERRLHATQLGLRSNPNPKRNTANLNILEPLPDEQAMFIAGWSKYNVIFILPNILYGAQHSYPKWVLSILAHVFGPELRFMPNVHDELVQVILVDDDL